MTENSQLTWLAQKRHERFHHPQGLAAKPYLTLPFDRKDLPRINGVPTYNITEGFRYSRVEQRIHGGRLHFGIDLAVPYGTPVVAPCDGLAISSYHSTLVRNKDGTVRKYRGKFICYSLGYFVQIKVKGMDRIVQLGHLSNICPEIPFSLPIEAGKGEWLPTNHQLPDEELLHSKWAVAVKTGDPLGWVGYSGMEWGYHEYEAGLKRPMTIDLKEKVSYDEPHVHLEEGRRIPEGKKVDQRDPEDIYLSAKNYPTPMRHRKMGPEPLFYCQEGLPVLAK
jgi:hypothetical protein